MKIGLFFGSFNPIHIGHLAIANYMAEFTDLEQVWLVVSPHNPAKDKKNLAEATKRFVSVKKAIGKNPKIKASDIEFGLSQPSYTVNTLKRLALEYPEEEFVIILGSDNLNSFHKWKDYKKILNGYELYIYPRLVGSKRPASQNIKRHPHVKIMNAPRMDISSTFIREQLKKGKDMRYFFPVRNRKEYGY
jgi:nicotinate-nucleotide adenylyltransferase